MDIRPRSSLVSRSYEYKTESRSESYDVSTSNTRNTVGLNWIDKSVRSKRPRIAPSDVRVSDSPQTSSERETTVEGSSNNGNSSGLLQRVSNTVSGLFSNVSWSDWLKSPSVPKSDSLNLESTQVSPGGSSESGESRSFSEIKSENQSFNLLYPEEGVTNFSDSGDESRRIDEPSENSSYFINSEPQPFKKNLSFISSTPSLSPSTYKRRGNEDFLCDSIIPKPSTSGYKNENITQKEDTIALLKKTFPEPRPEPIYQSNGSISTFPSGRKRLRDSIGEEIDETIGQNDSKRQNLDSLQLMTEETKRPEDSIQRKRPRFSISSYGSPLYKKQQEQEEPSFSIFYPGKIMYGGAANHQKRSRIIPRKISPRKPVVSKSIEDDYSDGGLSSAARRILNCIDKISSPLSDSKRALPFTSNRDYVLNSSTFVADFHKNRPTIKSSEGTTPPTTKLLTPSKVKITKNFASLLKTQLDSHKKEVSTVEESSVKKPQPEKINLPNAQPPPAKTVSSFSFKNSPIVSVPSKLSIPNSSLPEKQSPNVFIKNNSVEEVKNIEKNTKPLYEGIQEMKKSHNKNIFEMVEKIENKSPGSFGRSQPVSSSSNTDNGVTPLFTFSQNTKKDNISKEDTSSKDISFTFSEPVILSEESEVKKFLIGNTEFNFRSPINESRDSSEPESNLEVLSPWEKFKAPKDTWDCEICLLQNEASRVKCIACESPKPKQEGSGTLGNDSKASAFITNWGDKFKTPEGSWECDTCLLQNKKESEKCSACLAPKPKSSNSENASVLKSKSQPILGGVSEGAWQCKTCFMENKTSDIECCKCKSAKAKPGFFFNSKNINEPSSNVTASWGDAFKPCEGSWECAVCLVQNKADASFCVACTSQKPKSNSKTDVFSQFNSKKSTEFSSNASDMQSSSSWGDTFKPSQGSWECEICLVQNKADASSCVACTSHKPKCASQIDIQGSKGSSQIFGGFGKTLSKPDSNKDFLNEKIKNDDGISVCTTCRVTKKLGESCTACKNGKTNLVSNESLNTNTTFIGTFGADFMGNDNEWECETCLVRNKLSLQKCLSCETPRVQTNRTSIVSEAIKGNFKFGVPKHTPPEISSPIVSGNDNEWECETCLVRNKLSLQKCLSCETPRVQINRTSIVSEAITGNFKFGVPKQSSPESSSPIVSAVDVQKSTAPAVPPSDSSKFIFGSPFSLPTEVSQSNPAKPIIPAIVSPFTTPVTEPTDNTSTKFKASAIPPVTDKPKPVFQFGSSSVPAPKKPETKLEFPKISNFKPNLEKSDIFSQPFPKVNPSSFNFLGGEKKTSSPAPTFNQPATNNSSSLIPPFNPPTTNKETITAPVSTQSQSSPFVFGQQNTKTISTGFNFGEANQPKPGGFTFGNTGPSVFQFGQQTSTAATPSPALQPKPNEVAPPAFLNIEIPKSNPFNASGQQKRIIKKAVRKHK